MLFRGRVARVLFSFSSTTAGARERVRVAGDPGSTLAVEARSDRFGGGGCGVLSRVLPFAFGRLSGAGDNDPEENIEWLRFKGKALAGVSMSMLPLVVSGSTEELPIAAGVLLRLGPGDSVTSLVTGKSVPTAAFVVSLRFSIGCEKLSPDDCSESKLVPLMVIGRLHGVRSPSSQPIPVPVGDGERQSLAAESKLWMFHMLSPPRAWLGSLGKEDGPASHSWVNASVKVMRFAGSFSRSLAIKSIAASETSWACKVSRSKSIVKRERMRC